MALVCDFKSDATEEKSPISKEEAIDLEDGEIEDDEEETLAANPPSPPQPPPPVLPPPVPVPVPVPQEVVKPEFPVPVELPQPVIDKLKPMDKPEREKIRERGPPLGVRPERRKHDEKGKRYMTEAEKSILHLRKREEAQRKKWEKMNRNREVDPADDDFAKNIEKTLATILNKKEKEAATAASSSDDRDKDKSEWERDEEIRGKKRRKNEIKGNRQNKQRRFDSPMSDMEDPEMPQCPPETFEQPMDENTNHSLHSEDSYESEDTSDRNRIDERMKRREKKMMKRKRDRGYGKDKQKRQKKKNTFMGFDPRPICVFYMQGKCVKNDCNFSHMVNLPMKMEVCKFYLNSCCAKGDKCSYMHSEFPCKFYHTGLTCTAGDDCKFSHGKPLSDNLKQVLFKHIETAPREILGGFPRVSREEALSLVDVAQNKLQEQDYSGAEQDNADKGEEMKRPMQKFEVPREIANFDAVWAKATRGNPVRWQDWKPPENLFKPFNSGKDQDMRVNSNGDIDMRTLPPPPLGTIPPSDLKKDVDIRKIPEGFSSKDSESERKDESESGDNDDSSLPKNLPKTQRDLFLRIQAQQKDNVGDARKDGEPVDESNINWYSDDDDDDENRLTIKDDNEDIREKDEETDEKSDALVSPTQIKPQEVMEKLGDLSKIDISAEVTKLLTSMSQGRKFSATSQESTTSDDTSNTNTSTTTTTAAAAATTTTTSIVPSDPRIARQDPRTTQDKQESSRIDPRLSAPKQRSRQSSLDSQPKPEKVSIYEQGSIERSTSASEEADIDLRGMRSDVDLRNLQLPFKGMQNYTPASEIDGSLNSHEPIPWKLSLVEIPRPDYTGLKLSVSDAEKTGDPRLRKIFRLSTEERDTPLSPKASPKASTAIARVDPRLKKMEESKAEPPSGVMNYAQQLSALQSSPFYQNLTSNQKLLLNDEVSKLKGDPSEPNPVMNTLLGRLNIIPMPIGPSSPHLGQALNILSKLNYPMMNQGPPNNLPPHMAQNSNMMNQMGQNMNQPGLLGAAPGLPNMNMPPDYPMNFNPRNGLLGTAPPMGYGGFPPPDQQNNFNYGDDFYPPDGSENFQGNRSNRGFNRDRRRGGRGFNHRSGGRGYRRNNRANRNHSPP